MSYTLCTTINSYSNPDRTYVVFNIISFVGKPVGKISFRPLQSYFWAENIQTMSNFEWSNVLEPEI